eukprot:6111823-Amphidinium_carterae.1
MLYTRTQACQQGSSNRRLCNMDTNMLQPFARELGSTLESVTTALQQEALENAMAAEKALVAFLRKYGISLAVAETQHAYGWLFLAPFAQPEVTVHILWLHNRHFWKAPSRPLYFTHSLKKAGGKQNKSALKGHQGCHVTTSDWMARACGNASRLLLLACSNIIGWGTAQLQLESWMQHDRAEAWANARGLKLVQTGAIQTQNGGTQAGVAICVKKHIGISCIAVDTPDILQGRIVAALLNLGPPLTLVSVYFTTGLSDEARYEQWAALELVIATLAQPVGEGAAQLLPSLLRGEAHHKHMSASGQELFFGLADAYPKLNTTAALKVNLPNLVGTALSNARTPPRRESAWKHLSFSDPDKVDEILAEASVFKDEGILFGEHIEEDADEDDDEAPEVEELLELEEEEAPLLHGRERASSSPAGARSDCRTRSCQCKLF